MTDNLISKKDAIDRMRDGLPCETQCDKAWDRTFWRDFDDPRATFRIPPEPRREAREWKIGGGGCYEMIYGPIHVREVLPGDVACDRALRELVEAIDSQSLERMHEAMGQARHALGLIAENKS